eukprot:GSMAST32.ASY1.ANO1.592.1 assembled CDS
MESIYNWIQEDEVQEVKPPMYRSTHDRSRKVASSFGKQSGNHGTFGKPNNKPNPKQYLRGTRQSKPSKAKPWTRKRVVTAKQKLPGRKDRPVMGLQTTKDFVVSNAVENILAVPKARETKPNFLKKKDYGKTPEYLQHVKADIADEKKVIEQYFSKQEEQQNNQGGTLLDPTERANLCAQLKVKWDDTNQKYQRITHNTKLDTISKIRKKENFENLLDQLEKDIKLLSCNRPIVIMEN